MAIDYNKTRSALNDFLSQYGKLAEDPNRAGVTPDELKEGKPQTEEVNKGDGTEQGAPGTEMQKEVKENSVPEGTSVEGERKNDGNSDSGPKVEGTYNVTVSESPADDISKMDNVDADIKKACAQNILLGNRILQIIDQEFENMNAKVASEQDMMIQGIIAKAEEMKESHVRQVMQAFNCSAKVANDLMDTVAATDPTAVLPPETMSEEDADAILAEAAASADAAGAEDAAAAADADVAAATAPEGGEAVAGAEGEVPDAAAIEAELGQVVDQLSQEGYSEDEIASAIMEEMGITQDDVVGMVMDEFKSQGLSDEEAAQVVEELAALQEQGVTPEQLAAALGEGAQAEGGEVPAEPQA